MRPRLATVSILVAFGAATASSAAGPAVLVVEAGAHDRDDTPVQVQVERSRMPGRDPGQGEILREQDDARAQPIPLQIDPVPDDPSRVRLAFVLPGETAAGASRRFRLEAAPTESPWSLESGSDGSLSLANRGKIVFRYNVSPVESADHPPIQRRNAYIHPARSPSGAIVTGDFSKFHPHHRGFFLAYAKAKRDGRELDFWNIHRGLGRIRCDRLGAVETGPVTARFTALHRWEDGQGTAVLDERWDVQAWDVPGSPYWLIDLTSTQQALGEPLELVPYRYGGMAYRGPDPFQPAGVLDVRTSEGLTRQDADQKPARWVDLTGPIETGSDRYAGAMVADHPANVNHPSVARIHPTSLPFFSYVPSHDRAVTIPTDQPMVFRYRILIHDGHPDPALDERVWRDFADPPSARLEPSP